MRLAATLGAIRSPNPPIQFEIPFPRRAFGGARPVSDPDAARRSDDRLQVGHHPAGRTDHPDTAHVALMGHGLPVRRDDDLRIFRDAGNESPAESGIHGVLPDSSIRWLAIPGLCSKGTFSFQAPRRRKKSGESVGTTPTGVPSQKGRHPISIGRRPDPWRFRRNRHSGPAIGFRLFFRIKDRGGCVNLSDTARHGQAAPCARHSVPLSVSSRKARSRP